MKKKILVGMSGGVDSTVAAYLLKKQGHDVTGVTMGIYDKGCTSGDSRKSACYGPGEDMDIQDARETAKKIGIAHHVVDLQKEYKSVVLDDFCSGYLSGRTPNPCIICNQKIKFGLMLDKAREIGIEFDYFATGHYARKGYSSRSKRFFIKKSTDLQKDQSYFLYRLNQQQLATILFPLGDYVKSQVMDMALEAGFGDIAEKPESQDFYEGDDFSDFFQNVEIKPGDIVDNSGEIIGRHKGIIYYTIGQRKGLNIGGLKQPYYVIDINTRENQIIVGCQEELFSRSLIARDLKWFLMPEIEKEMRVKAKIRLHHADQSCRIVLHGDNTAKVLFDEPQMAVTPGQSIVFYKKDAVIGGGIIQRTG